jgi:cytochrome c2
MEPHRNPGWRWLLAWQCAAVALILLLPFAFLGEWPWALPRRELLSFGVLALAFAASCLLPWAVLSGIVRAPPYTATVLGTLAIFAGALAVLLLARSNASRTVVLGVLGTAALLLPLPLAHPRLKAVAVSVLGAALIGAAALGATKHPRSRTTAVKTTETHLSTNLYNVRVVAHSGRIPYPAVRGGGLAKLGDRILLGTGDGHLYVVSAGEKTIDVQPLALTVPLNGKEFAAAVGREYREPRRSSEYGVKAPPGVQTWRFRTADVLVQDLGDRMRLLASHHYWHDAEKCFVLRVSAIDLSRDGAPPPDAAWRTIFESTPCLPISGPDAKRGKNPFQGEEIGGRMALIDERTLLLTVGDMGFSGLESWQRLAQDPSASYGKTLRIDLETNTSEVFTLGHRNPQGVHVDADGEIWITEHGPKGGDELNLLRAGVNYGWPNVTYGTDYRSFVWPLNTQQGRHEGYPEPIFAWVPSIGVTSIIRIEGAQFPSWKGDFLIGSLTTRSLYRLRMSQGRVIFEEPIPIGYRVRDLLELDDGRILVWTDGASLLELSPSPGMNGALLFGALCESCHWMHDGLSHKNGPDLFGILNNKVAAASGFEYSPALRQLAGRWTDELMHQFLADPQAVAPGTTMAFEGIDDPRERELIIEHLRATEN